MSRYERMRPAADPAPAAKQTTLQRTLTTALNELGAESALVAICEREDGPLTAHGWRGFSQREVQAILRPLSMQELTALSAPVPDSRQGGTEEPVRAARLRLITPAAKSLLAVTLRYHQRPYGVLIIGRKEGAVFTKKERAILDTAGDTITGTLERASLFDGTVIWGRPRVAQEPIAAAEAPAQTFAAPSAYATEALQESVARLLNELGPTMPFERAWATAYDPVAGDVEVIGIAGEQRVDRKDLKPGQRLGLDASASGWAIRHRKPRVDHDLASTQGRFLDHKHLYKDRFRSAMVVPFFVRGQVGGTITLASRTPMQYTMPDVRTLEPGVVKMAEAIASSTAMPPPQPSRMPDGEPDAHPAPSSEPLIRKQERQAAIGEFSAFLATEVREPLASIRAQLDEVTGAGTLDFDSQTRVENAMRDLIRVEALLHEILDFAKPLELTRRPCRIPDVIENALTVVATDLEVNRIGVTKEYSPQVPPVRCDDGKMQQVFLSIFKNALEAMTPGGHLHIEVSAQKTGRAYEAQILIKNDGVPIPTEHMGKIFEPYFTTKRTGTGLGLATVKKIVEEHHGQISIASGPGQGTTVIIRLPFPPRGQHFRRRGRGRRSRGR